MRAWIFALLLVAVPPAHALDRPSQRVRRLYLKRDEIAWVRTAVGIATIIQVPDRPTSVVLGDTNAFKVEYLENAITIKPLSHSSRSNLYIYTEARRFNVSLTTVPISGADYIVYLEPKVLNSIPLRERWRNLRIERKSRGLAVTVTRLGQSGDFLMVVFQVTAKKAVKFKPEWIWVTQNGRTVPIQDLNLSAIDVMGHAPVSAFLDIKRTDLRGKGPLALEVRSPSPIKIRLPELHQWLR